MERLKAIEQLKQLQGKELQLLAIQYDVTVLSKLGNVNKGWAGHAIERYLGLPINSAQSPNFGSWELKSIPLKTLKNGELSFKETMAITMIDSYNVINTSFEDSHLLSKLKKMVCVVRTVGVTYEDPSFVHSVVSFDLSGELYDGVRADYDLIRDCLSDPKRGFAALTGYMGKYIQPRTKGAKNSTSRAFYARPLFLRQFVVLDKMINE